MSSCLTMCHFVIIQARDVQNNVHLASGTMLITKMLIRDFACHQFIRDEILPINFFFYPLYFYLNLIYNYLNVYYLLR